jgi:hypothetical protein
MSSARHTAWFWRLRPPQLLVTPPTHASAATIPPGMVIALAVGFLWQGWASYVGFNVSATHSISACSDVVSLAYLSVCLSNCALATPNVLPHGADVIPAAATVLRLPTILITPAPCPCVVVQSVASLALHWCLTVARGCSGRPPTPARFPPTRA